MLTRQLRIRWGRSGDVINLFSQRIAIISCIKSIAGIDGRSLFLGSTLGIGMPNVGRLGNAASIAIKKLKSMSKFPNFIRLTFLRHLTFLVTV